MIRIDQQILQEPELQVGQADWRAAADADGLVFHVQGQVSGLVETIPGLTGRLQRLAPAQQGSNVRQQVARAERFG